jgi:hypothetical protein
MRTFGIVLSALAFTFGIVATGCSSEPPSTDDTQELRQAICSGGGGGGDSCTSADGYCPPECGYCFNSVNEKLQLQNMWECTGEGGGGGGGGGEACSSPTNYTGFADGYADDQSTAQQHADDDATFNAESRCRNSALICTPHVSSTSVSQLGCSEVITPGYYRWHCRAQATTNCTYTYW